MSGNRMKEIPLILVADDESHILHVVGLKLRHAGYRVALAVDGGQAYESALAEAPAVLITDYQMPVMTGLDLANRLREQEAMRRLPVIMLTARGFGLDPEQTNAAGVVATISKPFSPREILSRVEALTGKAKPSKVV